MNDVWSDPIPEPINPCIKKCGVNSTTGYCSGCYRKLDEIAKWSGLEIEEKIEILKLIKERKAKNEG